jgi:hypothetical protein
MGVNSGGEDAAQKTRDRSERSLRAAINAISDVVADEHTAILERVASEASTTMLRLPPHE